MPNRMNPLPQWQRQSEKDFSVDCWFAGAPNLMVPISQVLFQGWPFRLTGHSLRLICRDLRPLQLLVACRFFRTFDQATVRMTCG